MTSADNTTTRQKLRILENAIRGAKKKAEVAQAAEDRVYEILEDMHINLDAITEAENACNLGEAVSCYLSYGEYDIDGLMREIREQCTGRDTHET